MDVGDNNLSYLEAIHNFVEVSTITSEVALLLKLFCLTFLYKLCIMCEKDQIIP